MQYKRGVLYNIFEKKNVPFNTDAPPKKGKKSYISINIAALVDNVQ